MQYSCRNIKKTWISSLSITSSSLVSLYKTISELGPHAPCYVCYMGLYHRAYTCQLWFDELISIRDIAAVGI